MKKLFTTLSLALVAMTSFAQEQNDTTYVMFDFNLNPWGYPVSTVKDNKGWDADYDDLTGAIKTETDFSWAIKEGADEKIVVTIYPPDPDEYNRMTLLCKRTCVNAGIQKADGSDSIMTILFAKPGTSMRCKAPTGYKFGKMVFHNYRTPNFLVGSEYEEKIINNEGFEETFKFWVPTSPKVSQYGVQMWDGDATNVLFNCPTFNAYFLKIDFRLVPDGTSGITELRANGQESATAVSLDGRSVSKSNLRKGIYIVDGKKYVVK